MPSSLPLTTIECQVCFEVVENAVHCIQCRQFLCERHVAQLHECPFCRATPFKLQIEYGIRRLVDQLPVSCAFCLQHIKKGDLNVHVNHCQHRPRNCGVNGCGFQTSFKEEALRHMMEAHGEILWDNYNKLTAAGTVPH